MFLIFAQKHRLWVHVRTASLSEAVLTSTHSLCFGATIRKKIHLYTPVSLYISVRGVRGYTLHELVFVMNFISTSLIVTAADI